MSTKVFSRDGDEIGIYANDNIVLNDGQHEWEIVDGNVYDTHENFIGHLCDDTICSMTGEVLYALGKPYEDL